MKPLYTAKPIGSLGALALALAVDRSALLDIAKSTAERYTKFEIPKTNGGMRAVCAPHYDLKVIQKRLNRAVFSHVQYPDYLYGGIAGRDYVQNARQHTNARAIIALDLKNFYPSIPFKRVLEVFRYFCNFPLDVAETIASLCTLEGAVPQGACTSSHIANLAFFDTEHRIVREFRQAGLTYTRLLDDITVSAPKILDKNSTTRVVEKVRAMAKSQQMRLKAEKTRITTASNPEQLMEVTGLWLNRGEPRVHRAERREIRASVRRCQVHAQVSLSDPDYHAEHNRLLGRISKLGYLQHFEASEWRDRLRNIQPIYDAADIIKTKRMTASVARVSIHDRRKAAYHERYYQVIHRINILARTHAKLASALRKQLQKCHPPLSREDLTYGAA